MTQVKVFIVWIVATYKYATLEQFRNFNVIYSLVYGLINEAVPSPHYTAHW